MTTQFTAMASTITIHGAWCACGPCLRDEEIRADTLWDMRSDEEPDDWQDYVHPDEWPEDLWDEDAA